jgi:hypothetical protein
MSGAAVQLPDLQAQAVEWKRPTDEEWRAMLDAREARINHYFEIGALKEESIEDVEAYLAEELRRDGHHTPEGIAELFPDVLKFTTVADAGPVEAPLFTNGVRRGDLGLLLAESGMGKSYVMLALAASLSTGEVILPAFTPEGWETSEPVRVLLVGYEDPAPIVRDRLDAIDGSGAWREAEADGMLGFLLDMGPLFDMQGRTVAPTVAGKRLDATLGRFQPDVVLIDPLSGAAVLDDENANAALHRVAVLLVDLARKHDCAIIMSHHASKAKAEVATQHMARGASSLACRARWILTLTQPGDLNGPDLVQATIVKNSYERPTGPILLRREAGGALLQVSHSELAGVQYEALARTFAESLGENEAEWSQRDIVKESKCGEFREALKLVHKKSMNRDGLKLAYDIALERGWIVEVKQQTGGSEKRIPRLRKGGINS